MDLSNYLEMFIEESKEHLQAINDELLKLELEPDNTAIVNEIFRSAHTLKGMAGSMGFEDLASLTHQMENVLDLLRNSKLTVNSQIMDVIFNCVDLIEKMVDSIENGGDGKANVAEVVFELKKIQDPSLAIDTSLSSASRETAVTAVEEIILDEFQNSLISEARNSGINVFQITVTIDEQCVMKAIRAYLVFQTAEELGEIIQTHPTVEQIEQDEFGHSFSIMMLSDRDSQEIKKQLMNVSEVKEVIVSDEINRKTEEVIPVEVVKQEIVATANKEETTGVKKKQRSKSIRVDIDKLDHLMNLFSELIIDRGRLEQIAKDSQLLVLSETVEHMTRISSDLQGVILNMRMVQIEQVFNRFPRMIRDLAKELNKKINLVVDGEDTELDRTVIDEIGDPLVHLLRNALDHGLETTEERILSNKPEEGRVELKAYHSGNNVFIEVSDDGKGINRDKVLNKAIERDVVKMEEAESLSDQQVYSLLFSSGFSTADKISDISGRGVGLDVVKSKIESLGGVITIDSTLGQGSTFRIQLPLTLSIIFAMLVQVEEETYAIPFNSIVEITSELPENITTIHGQKMIQFRDQVVPLIYLKDELDVPPSKTKVDQEELFIVIIGKGNKTKGIVVDSVLGQQEVVLKSLGEYLSDLYAVSGATILGNGKVALIIDPNEFFI